MLALESIDRKAVVQGILIPSGLDVEHGMYRLAIRTSDGARFEIHGDEEIESMQALIGEEIVVRGALQYDGERRIVLVRSYELVEPELRDDEIGDEYDGDFDDEYDYESGD